MGGKALLFPISNQTPSVHQGAKPHVLHYCLIRNQSILWNDDDAITDVVAAVRRVEMVDACFIQQLHVSADARVLVDNGPAHDCSFANADARSLRLAVAEHVFQGLIEVSTHHVGGVEVRAFANAAAQSDDTATDLRAVDDAAVADNRIAYFAVIYF